MAKRLTLILVLGLVPAGVALAGDNYGQQKAALDAQLNAVEAKAAAAHARAVRLDNQIGSLTTQIHTLEAKVGDVSSKLSALQADLALHQRRLDKLNAVFHLQTVRFHYLRRAYQLAVRRLDSRLVTIYEQNDPTTLDFLLSAKSFQDVLDQLDYLGAIAQQDKKVALEVRAARHKIRIQRLKTAQARSSVRQEAAVISARAQQQAMLRGQLIAGQNHLAGARSSQLGALAATKKQEQEALDEAQQIKAASAAIEAKIRASQTKTTAGSEPATASAAGFIWPVSGPITSPFGMRWGTLHPGIDIGVPTGTPIHAAGAGTVIYCGEMSGYGNLVVIDHHNGLATAYGHQSRIAAGCGENVSQGQVIGYSGCTGFCTGPHLHFEVRVNGSPVDPLGYLP